MKGRARVIKPPKMPIPTAVPHMYMYMNICIYICTSYMYLGSIQDIESFKALVFCVRRLVLITISLLAVLKTHRDTKYWYRHAHTHCGKGYTYTFI